MVGLHKSEKGVSLIEVLVALFILSVVGAIVVAGVFVAVMGNSHSRSNILAEGLARYELEYVKSVAADNWTNITSLTDPYYYTIPSAQGPAWNTAHKSLPSSEYTGYTAVITISSMAAYKDKDNNNSANIRKVDAAVSYNGSNFISIDTYIVGP